VDIWIFPAGSLERTLPFTGAGGRCFSVAFINEGSFLAVLKQDIAATVWETGDWLETPRGEAVETMMRDWRNHQRGSWDMAVLGDVFVSGTDDGWLRWYDLTTGRCFLETPCHSDTARDRAFSPDGRLLVSVSFDGGVVVLDVATRQELRRWNARSRQLEEVVFSPDGRRIATSYRGDAGVDIWDWQATRCVLSLPTDGTVGEISWSENGRRLFAMAGDQKLYIWDAPSFQDGGVPPSGD
jgi:WD40 repeat protein